jgi:hypothetical protein
MSDISLSVRDIHKKAQPAAVLRTAQSLFKIIQFLLYRVPEKQKRRYLSRVRGKISRISPAELGVKTMPMSATIGQSISITKNLLSGLNPMFVNQVIVELSKLLSTAPGYMPPPAPGEKI